MNNNNWPHFPSNQHGQTFFMQLSTGYLEVSPGLVQAILARELTTAWHKHVTSAGKETLQKPPAAPSAVQVRDKMGNTALHYALADFPESTDDIIKRKAVIALMLLMAGSDMLAPNNKGERPCDYIDPEDIEAYGFNRVPLSPPAAERVIQRLGKNLTPNVN